MTRYLITMIALILMTGCAAKPDLPRLSDKTAPSAAKIEQILANDNLTREQKAAQLKAWMLPEKSPRQKEEDALLTSVMREPTVPLKMPDTIVRVMILPYVDANGALNSPRFRWVEVENGKWIMGNYLQQEKSTGTVLNPLKDAAQDEITGKQNVKKQ